jgi:hypothetical protein
MNSVLRAPIRSGSGAGVLLHSRRFFAWNGDLFKELVMSGRWMFRLCLAVGALCVAWSAAQAAPWSDLISLKSVDTDPKKSYAVAEENGPWMVMACSFSGEGAEKQARDLVMELRARYKLPAYVYLGHFDPGEAQVRGVDKYGKQRKGNYWKYKDAKDKEKARHPDLVEVAVLVGNFRTADDSKAQTMLHTIKFARPKCLEVKEGQATNQTLTGWRRAQQQVYEMIGSSKKELGPMRHSFVTPNPLLPPDYFNQRGLDEETIALNKGVPHSLLECPGKFTVQVATFKGNAVIKQTEIQDIQEGRKEMQSQLAAAAQEADALVKKLRELGYEAYQFHDRYTSIVTVGSFMSPGMPLQNGQVDVDPKITKIIEVFRAGEQNPDDPLQSQLQNASRALTAQRMDVHAVAPKRINVGTHDEPVFIPFDVQPLLVQVPKRPISMSSGGVE